ncbi:MAG: hypothetical protein F9K23_04425 [Bacteroidetes bacterium]|nr:MAG: hypothetical protein F9K23_04425 [Bacteroidota bacterium]
MRTSVKQLFLLLAAGCIILVNACGDKQPAQSKLVGIWQGTDYSHDLKDVPAMYEQGGKEMNKNTRYIFKDDSTFTEIRFTYESTGKWYYNANDKKLTLEFTKMQGPQEINKPVYEVVTLTDKELKLKNSLNGQGFEYLTFTKK